MGEQEQQQLQKKALEYHIIFKGLVESGNQIRLYNAYDCNGNPIQIVQTVH